MASYLRLFVLLIIITSLCTRADIIPPMLDCPSPAPSPAPSPSPNTVGNSVFRDNVAALLKALPSTAMSSDGFASIENGDGGDRAFVRGLCLAHALGDCQACLSNAGYQLYRHCNSSRRAAIWYEKCFLSYADTNTSTAYEEGYRKALNNVNIVSDENAFERAYKALMNRLVARAINGSSSEPVPMFATGHSVYDHVAPTPNGIMYGLVQCMRDRTAAECRQCLKHSVAEAPKCCYGYQGKVVLGYNCYVRVEIYTYYDPALDTPPTPRPLAGKGKLFLNYFYVSPGF
jgi:hypothetical protein